MGAEQQTALVTTFTAVDARIRARIVQALLQVFTALGSWRDTDIKRFTAVAVPLMIGAERQMGSLTGAFIAAMAADLLGVPVRPAPVAVATGAELRGVDPGEVYARPIRTVWRGLAAGNDLDAALDAGRLRLEQLATTDLQLAKTHAARTALAGDERIVGYRRVLTGTRSCGLCVVASTQRYHRAELLPIHPGCDCGISPIVGSQDPGQVLNEPLLEGAHAAIMERFGSSGRTGRGPVDFRDVLVTHEHGEIGPILARRGDAFTGPGDVA